MTRVNFNLKFNADNVDVASAVATKVVAEFLGIDESSVSDKVSMEMKVEIPEEPSALGKYTVIVSGQVKNGFVPTPH